MKRSPLAGLRKAARETFRGGMAALPRRLRFAMYRSMVECDFSPDARLQLKIAETQDELEACFRILHDSYVAAGFMKPDPSGLRVTIYHALPTTTTLCAKWDGVIVGTISIIREGVFGFPLQSVFDLSGLRALGGNITEVSSLAVDPRYRKTGGQVLFPLMKFMREYSRRYFDTRHLVIAVNPNRIEMYEALLCFERLRACEVDRYDFANGAPAVGATLDLHHSDEQTRRLYRGRPRRRDLHRYLYVDTLPNIQQPLRRFHTTNDPVLTPAMMDHFFNRRTRVFDSLDDRKRALLRSIYDRDDYAAVLPQPSRPAAEGAQLRRHQRFSLRCPAAFRVESGGVETVHALAVIEISLYGFQAECAAQLAPGTSGRVVVELGADEIATVDASTVRCHQDEIRGTLYLGFSLREPDEAWRRCVAALHDGCTHRDLAPRVAAPARAEPSPRTEATLCALASP